MILYTSESGMNNPRQNGTREQPFLTSAYVKKIIADDWSPHVQATSFIYDVDEKTLTPIKDDYTLADIAKAVEEINEDIDISSLIEVKIKTLKDRAEEINKEINKEINEFQKQLKPQIEKGYYCDPATKAYYYVVAVLARHVKVIELTDGSISTTIIKFEKIKHWTKIERSVFKESFDREHRLMEDLFRA